MRIVIVNTHDLVGKVVWHWQFYFSLRGKQILASSKPGEDSLIRHCAQSRTLDIGMGLSIPDDLDCIVKEDRVEIDLGDAHVVLRLRD